MSMHARTQESSNHGDGERNEVKSITDQTAEIRAPGLTPAVLCDLGESAQPLSTSIFTSAKWRQQQDLPLMGVNEDPTRETM